MSTDHFWLAPLHGVERAEARYTAPDVVEPRTDEDWTRRASPRRGSSLARSHSLSRRSVDPNALKVLYRLERSGFESCLVGGSVRDLLLGREPKDFDVATDARPERGAPALPQLADHRAALPSGPRLLP